MLGFWRRKNAENQLRRLRGELKEPFLLAVSEQLNLDESIDEDLSSHIYRFKRMPLVDEVIRLAREQLKI